MACTAVLLLGASGLLTLNLGNPLIRGLPADSEERQAYRAATQGFRPRSALAIGPRGRGPRCHGAAPGACQVAAPAERAAGRRPSSRTWRPADRGAVRSRPVAHGRRRSVLHRPAQRSAGRAGGQRSSSGATATAGPPVGFRAGVQLRLVRRRHGPGGGNRRSDGQRPGPDRSRGAGGHLHHPRDIPPRAHRAALPGRGERSGTGWRRWASRPTCWATSKGTAR